MMKSSFAVVHFSNNPYIFHHCSFVKQVEAPLEEASAVCSIVKDSMESPFSSSMLLVPIPVKLFVIQDIIKCIQHSLLFLCVSIYVDQLVILLDH